MIGPESKTHILKIEKVLREFNFDILILTESVDLDLPMYNYIYKSKQLPQNISYEGLNYFEYLNGNSAYRVSIYSKYQSSRTFKVSDEFTSVCKEFETPIGPMVIYATIIGTWFNKQPYAKIELYNCISDCLRISQKTNSFCLAGDLNTSFIHEEKELQISGIESRKMLLDLCKACKLDLSTKSISNNIDHIFLSKSLNRTLAINPKVFVTKGILSDHQGIALDIQEKYIS